LQIEAMVSNRDIGFVRAGQAVEIKVDTFPFTRYGLLHGKVLNISLDAVARHHRKQRLRRSDDAAHGMHRELLHDGRPPAAQHTALDPFQTTVWDACGLMAVERAGLMGYMDFRQAYSALELPKLAASGARFGLVYVDGSHLFEDVFVDAYFVIRLLIEGGVVAFDDSSNPHIAKVLRFLRTSVPPRALEELDLSHYRGKQDQFSYFSYRVARYFRKVQLTAFRRIGDVERAWDASFHSF
jgi:methyltransferase family protein/HlyD family secretion protein